MTDVYQLHPAPEQYTFTFGGNDPLLRVPPRSIIELSTEDCFMGKVRSVADLPSQVVEFPYLNPVTGPIHVDGAEPGDILAVHFIEIRPRRDWAVSSTFPHFGALTGTHSTAMLHAALEERVWLYELDLDRGSCTYRARNSDLAIDLPLDPFHGTVGVAPGAGERIMTITPSAHGGNMDTPELRAGVTAYFPVSVPGAALAIGDGHARQGEGEVCGTAVEAAMHTTIVVDVIKGAAPLATPRLESDDHLMSTGSVRPLEDAFRISQRDLVDWVSHLMDLDDLDALQLVSQTVSAPAGNVVDTNYTMLAKMPKAYLPGATVYDEVHARLAGIGRDHLARR